MGILDALFLGILQGVAEFLPISSSGHLALMQYFLGIEDTPRFFDVMLHVGTLAAVLLFYRRALWLGPRQWLARTPSPEPIVASAPDGHPLPNLWLPSPWRIVAFLLLATLPAVVAALVFRPTRLAPGQSWTEAPRSWRNRIGDIREYASQRPWEIIGFLSTTGLVLVAGARATGGKTDYPHLRAWQVLVMGLAQAASALCPGLSRSGMTVSAGMLTGVRAEAAVHFSLLMSIPAILGALVLKGRDLDPAWLTPGNIRATAVGVVTSAVVGWFSIALLLKTVRRGRWWWFSLYLWLVAAVVAALLLARGAAAHGNRGVGPSASRAVGAKVSLRKLTSPSLSVGSWDDSRGFAGRDGVRLASRRAASRRTPGSSSPRRAVKAALAASGNLATRASPVAAAQRTSRLGSSNATTSA